jgi:hypothetical protein
VAISLHSLEFKTNSITALTSSRFSFPFIPPTPTINLRAIHPFSTHHTRTGTRTHTNTRPNQRIPNRPFSFIKVSQVRKEDE